MEEIRPDKPKQSLANHIRLFLAGSIEQGKAENWQANVVKELAHFNLLHIYNPRIEKWDDKLEQTILNDQFRRQVLWEQKYLTTANIVLFNFIGDTKSPISLLELGQCTVNSEQKVIVVCPPEFWRRGNIEVVCNIFKMPLYRTLDEGVTHIKAMFEYGRL